MPDYLSTRYHTNAPVRLAIIPFSVAANLAGSNNENPGLGNELAWLSQSHLIDSTIFPIVEVFNRQDWPGKKEEFYTGNFGAITAARDAGYDLVLVGQVDPITSLDSLSATTKLIEADSGMTLWYGTTKVRSEARDINQELSTWWTSTRIPSVLDTNAMKQDLARCIVREIISEKIS